MDERALNDLLECSVCLERLDTSSKVLPCQHTFCRKCLEIIVASRKELRCPECRILVDIKIDDLPPNVLLMRLLEGMRNAAAARSYQQQQDPSKCKNVNDGRQENAVEGIEQITKSQAHQLQTQMPLQAQANHESTNANATTRRCLLPHAYALYDFVSSEHSDLNFKKGDLVLLKRKIDSNWYIGQLSGKEGSFPINYVQVIVPLPASTPQCFALYDFKMGPNEEEGCLTFKKGTLIHVLRRVDHNWAEGRIGGNIGIFPIAFVELNALAKKLIDSAVLPNATAIPNTSAGAVNIASPQQMQPPRNLPPIPIIDPTVNVNSDTTSPSSCSNATSPNSTATSSSSNSSSNSMPSSPYQSLPNTPQHTANSVRYRNNNEKRHSLNALLSNGTATLSIMQTNRHSAEILSIPTDINVIATNTAGNSQNHQAPNAVADADLPITAAAAADAHVMAGREEQPANAAHSTHARINVLKTSGHRVAPTLPWGYLALYPYKPRKADELELKKGCVYVVTERCLDGWFKGKNWQDTAGVFPGNYVTPLRSRDQQQLMHQWQFVPLQSSSTGCPSLVTSTNTNKNQHSLENLNARLGAFLPQGPPDLPPRNIGSNQTAATTAATASVWCKPLGQTVEAFFNRHNSNNKTTIEQNAKDAHEKENRSRNKTSATAAATAAATTTSCSPAVSLMKRLTHIKTRSKSPNVASASTTAISSFPATPQQYNSNLNFSVGRENTTFEDVCPTTSLLLKNSGQLTNTNMQLHPVHIRSGSCPSQLLQSPPTDLSTTSQTNESVPQIIQQPLAPHIPPCSAQINYGSQRIKGNKERMPAINLRSNVENNLRGTQRQSQQTALPSTAINKMVITKCSQQQHQLQQLQGHTNVHNVQHRKSQSLDANGFTQIPPTITTTAATSNSATPNLMESRFRCIAPFPSSSEFELELHLGDIVFVQRKSKNGWYKGMHAHTKKVGLFPSSFVEPDI